MNINRLDKTGLICAILGSLMISMLYLVSGIGIPLTGKVIAYTFSVATTQFSVP